MNHLVVSANIDGIFFGAVKDHWEGKPPSAIQKDRVNGRQLITTLGFSGDAQADLTVHGGEDKAIHHYAFDHYPAWQAEDLMAPGTVPAAFGENISTTGLTEENLCIGDILSLGTAVVQISQGRQPCWKLGLYTGRKEMPYRFQKTGRTGWYYRVLEPGEVGAGDRITLAERPNPNWSVLAVTRARLTRKITSADAETLANVVELAVGWRQAFSRMADGEKKEDTSSRLGA